MLVHHYLEYYARNNPDGPCISQGGEIISYGQLNEQANRLAHGFLALGVQPGQRVAVLGENSIEHSLVFMAASKVGAVSVPLNYRLAAEELAFIINDSSARALLMLRNRQPTASPRARPRPAWPYARSRCGKRHMLW